MLPVLYLRATAARALLLFLCRVADPFRGCRDRSDGSAHGSISGNYIEKEEQQEEVRGQIAMFGVPILMLCHRV